MNESANVSVNIRYERERCDSVMKELGERGFAMERHLPNRCILTGALPTEELAAARAVAGITAFDIDAGVTTGLER